MSQCEFSQILDELQSGAVVPYLGPGVLQDVANPLTGSRMPADDEALILAMNRGQPVNPKLMVEFPRAAMHFELKRGRKTLTNFLNDLYGQTSWTPGGIHSWLASLSLPYIIDTNRDALLQGLWADRRHALVVGIARLSADPHRFRLFEFDGHDYCETKLENFNSEIPVLFKPLGTPRPEPTFVASDADFVDYITELMGGFAIPRPLKQFRREKKYLVLGTRFLRDTQRMILSDIIVDSATPAGWALISQPTAKERRFCASKGLEIIQADWPEFLAFASSISH